jgi:hypothetical protein
MDGHQGRRYIEKAHHRSSNKSVQGLWIKIEIAFIPDGYPSFTIILVSASLASPSKLMTIKIQPY